MVHQSLILFFEMDLGDYQFLVSCRLLHTCLEVGVRQGSHHTDHIPSSADAAVVAPVGTSFPPRNPLGCLIVHLPTWVS